MNLKIQEAVGERKVQLDLTLASCISRTLVRHSVVIGLNSR